MTTWTLQPRDPLMARDGKPFSASAGAKARSLALPPPSMLAGAWRSWLGRDAQGHFDPRRVPELLAQPVLGPLLQVQKGDAQAWEALAPVPLDAFAEGDEKGLAVRQWHRLEPKPLTTWHADAQCDWGDAPLQPVAFVGDGPRSKPAKQVAPYWTWAAFQAWLEGQEALMPHQVGQQVAGPVAEGRLHVGLRPGERVSDEGALFFTESRAYESWDRKKGEGARYALGFKTGDAGAQAGAMAVGGERRLGFWCAEGHWPEASEKVVASIARTGRARVVLLSPAAFDAGWLPTWALSGAVAGVRGQVVAAAVGRPLVLSGWRLDPEGGPGRPKPTRRLAPAASVYWVELQGDEASRRAWAEAMWLNSCSDQAQDRFDGFGLAALGVWEG